VSDGEDGDGLRAVWARLARPFDTAVVVEAMLGLPLRATRQMVGAVLATCAEAETLLDGMPITLRSLAISTTDKAERCYGEVRGPVLWSETVAARRASAGDQGVFVCATPAKAYDTDENRVLVAALLALRKAGHDVESMDAQNYDDEMLRRARHNAGRAVRFLEHRALSSVTKGRPTGRAMRRTRAGTRRSTYRAAVNMVDRTRDPIDVDELEGFCDAHTSAQLDMLAALASGLDASGVPVGPFRAVGGALEAGPVVFRHPQRRGGRGEADGISLGGTIIDLGADVRSAVETYLSR
jgi:hypothetical protein